METQILQVREPYNYIHCNGSTALHVATLIVYEAKVNEDGGYVLETHSHPIVQYYDRPGGTVWNRAELRDCDVICSEADMTIPLKKFRMILSRHPENEENTYEGTGLNPIWKRDLESLGIKVGWPTDENGDEQKEFEVKLDIKSNEKFPVICQDHYSDFFFYIEADSLEGLGPFLMGARNWYYQVFSEHRFKITFVCDDIRLYDTLSIINSAPW